MRREGRGQGRGQGRLKGRWRGRRRVGGPPRKANERNVDLRNIFGVRESRGDPESRVPARALLNSAASEGDPAVMRGERWALAAPSPLLAPVAFIIGQGALELP
jgi:hypothetical protein